MIFGWSQNHTPKTHYWNNLDIYDSLDKTFLLLSHLSFGNNTFLYSQTVKKIILKTFRNVVQTDTVSNMFYSPSQSLNIETMLMDSLRVTMFMCRVT